MSGTEHVSNDDKTEHSVLYVGTAIPALAWTGPEVSKKMRFPDFKAIGR